MHDARLNGTAPVTPALLLAPVGFDTLERSPRVLLLVGDFAAALAPPDTGAPLVWVRPVTGVPDHPAVSTHQPAHPPSVPV